MDDLKLIKKHYGEKMMHLCRELFPTILETPGLLFKIMSSKFAYSRFLYDDIVGNYYEDEFKAEIYSMVQKQDMKETITDKTPKELLEEAGYILYECHTEEEIQSFKKYYAPNEALCTFRGGRLNRCHVFFAVKKNVDKIKRENFKNPQRQDEYGTSVISIQFDRDSSNTLSIKNRYNHTVTNPDSTFYNDLDNIIPGLTYAFEKTYGLRSKTKSEEFELTNYVKANDNKLYKYTKEDNNIYYCPNNIIIDNFEVKEYDKSRYIIFEHFILDMQEKKIFTYESNDTNAKNRTPINNNINEEEVSCKDDSFIQSIPDINKIEVINENNNKTIIINNDIKIVINPEGRILEYTNPLVTEIGNNFMLSCDELKKLNLPNVKKIGDNFLKTRYNPELEEIDLPNVEIVGNNFMSSATSMKLIKMPNLKETGDDFFSWLKDRGETTFSKLEKVGSRFLHGCNDNRPIIFPNLKEVGDDFMTYSNTSEVNLPKVEKIGSYFLMFNDKLKSIDLPSAVTIESFFLSHNKNLEFANLPNVNVIGDSFLKNNWSLSSIYIPNVEEIGDDFLRYNTSLINIDISKAKKVGDNFLFETSKLQTINCQNLEIVGNGFIKNGGYLKTIDCPKIRIIGNNFLQHNYEIRNIFFPNAEIIGDNFISSNYTIEKVDLPNVEKIGDHFLEYASQLKEIDLPNVEIIGTNFLYHVPDIVKFNAPKLITLGPSSILENPYTIITSEFKIPQELKEKYSANPANQI